MNIYDSALRRADGWIKADELAARLHLSNPRKLRGKTSPIRSLAISGDDGYKHVELATDAEFCRYCDRLRSHAIEELRHVQTLRRSRMSQKQGYFGFLDAQ